LVEPNVADSVDMTPGMTPKKQAELVAKRLRAAADFSVATVDRSAASPALAGARAHAVMLPTWNVPHVAGRLDAGRRVSLHSLSECPDADRFDVTFHGPFVVLSPSSTGLRRGQCGVENQPRNGSVHRRLRLSVAVTER
jgi:hypothetical protein